MNELQQKISAIGVVPVIKLTNPTRDAGPLSDALCAGGVPVAEITFRAVPGIRFYKMEIPAEELEDRLPAGQTRDFYRVTLTGEGEGEISLPGIPNLWLNDQRSCPGDLWALAGEDTLEGVYFRMLRSQAEAGDTAAALAARISRDLLMGKEVALP